MKKNKTSQLAAGLLSLAFLSKPSWSLAVDAPLSPVWRQLYNSDASPEEDSDSDGVSNRRECLMGTDPNDPSSRLRVLFCEWRVPDGQVHVRFPAAQGKRYLFELTRGLLGPATRWNEWTRYDHDAGDAEVSLDLDLLEEFAQGELQSAFLRLRVSDRDSDQDGISDWEEHVIGSLPFEAHEEDQSTLAAWLGEEGEVEADEDGEGETEDESEPLYLDDAIVELWELNQEEPDALIEELGESSPLIPILDELQAIEDEDQLWDLLESWDDSRWNTISQALQDLGYTIAQEDEEGDDTDEDAIDGILLDLWNQSTEDIQSLLNQIGPSSELASLIAPFPNVQSEEDLWELVDAWTDSQWDTFLDEIERLGLVVSDEEDSESPEEADDPDSDEEFDPIVDLWRQSTEDPAGLAQRIGSDSALATLIAPFAQFQDEDALWEHVENWTDAQWETFDQELERLGLSGEPIEEDGPESAEDRILDFWYQISESPGEVEAELPQDSILLPVVAELRRLSDEEAVLQYAEGLESQRREAIVAALQSFDSFEEGDDEGFDLEQAIEALWERLQQGEEVAIDGIGDSDTLAALIRELEPIQTFEELETFIETLTPERVATLQPEFEALGYGGVLPILQIDRDGITIPLVPAFQPTNGSNVPPSQAARFLKQASFGADYELIQTVARSGIEAWINYQIDLPPTYHLPANNTLGIQFLEAGEDVYVSDYRWTWWETAMKAPDTLRQRVAFALSEILVISDRTDVLEDVQWGIASYYDVLIDGAFGNYRDTLLRVSRHPAMGYWLSHVKNQPTNLELNRFPDENYARELMQLFAIGLFELNPDGIRTLDANGEPIPTYDNRDITELAKVFTGLTFNPAFPNDGSPYYGDEDEAWTITSVEDYLDVEDHFLTLPMFAFEPMHEPGPKTFLGATIPGGTVTEDLEAAIDVIFNHPNVGPFIATRLIQRLVTSNPSPDYVERVSRVFANNGSGVRGDMGSVIKAILLDTEARRPAQPDDPHYGRLREPYLRYTQLCRAFNASTESGGFRNSASEADKAMGQSPMQSPSVFNFFLPDHQPQGAIGDAGLVGPEFQITTATTTVSTINFWSQALRANLMELPEDFMSDSVYLDLSDEVALTDNPEALIDRLDLILTHGSLSATSRQIILQALNEAAAMTSPSERVQLALYLLVNSPDFAVFK